MDFYAGSVGDGAAMVGVQAASVQVIHRSAGTAHAGNNHDLILINAGLLEGTDNCLQNDSVSIAGAPHGFQLIFPEILVKNMHLISHP